MAGLRRSALVGAIDEVLANDNCSGCGACASLFKGVSMELDGAGFARPTIGALDPKSDRADARSFKSVCPGSRLTAPLVEPGTSHDRTFGRYRSVWQGNAAESDIRHAGSSAGVLTALAAWLLASGRSTAVVGAAQSSDAPRRTVPVRITTRDEALLASGSRYAPVSTAAGLAPDTAVALVGKPCEVSAVVQAGLGSTPTDRQPRLSFFCAGTPSQHATDGLLAELGLDPERLGSLRYRGNGWPGAFTATSTDGRTASSTYDESWGNHLGRAVQWRCRICPDGTGEHADISVGDFWQADSRGYPTFDEADGLSVIIVRTQYGEALLQDAIEAGIIQARRIDLDAVRAVQPLQRDRRQTLFGRLVGRTLGGQRVPRYRGYRLMRMGLSNPRRTLRAARGSFRRTRTGR